MTHQPLILIILDGWGYTETNQYNAIAAAHKPTWDKLWQTYPHTLISGSGLDVGLPAGQMGNSEVGHLTIGAGRLVPQDYARIDHAIADKSFFNNTVLLQAVNSVISQDKAIHILGLLSPGGVHSHENQIHAMLELAASRGAKKIYLHAFLDGRDTPPKSALASLQALEKKCKQLQVGQIASIMGRYYAMDRDNRWERVQAAYDLLTQGKGVYRAQTAKAGLELAYERGETDEFVKPTAILNDSNLANIITDGDAVIFMNFRADRARQLTQAFTNTKFKHFARTVVPQLANFVTLTQYAKNIEAAIAFPPMNMQNGFGEVIAKQGWKQLRIAETEKYAHVTFFFNGGIETAFTGEERILIPSPRVATYDLQPEMSAFELTEQLVQAMTCGQFATIICNFANPDMVGHTGNFAATVKAIETIDQCLAKIVTATQAIGGELLITADHGNAECMFDENTQQQHTAHTTDPVPLLYIGRKATFSGENGTLADLAPTMLYLLGLAQPSEMTGRRLLNLE